jgi:aminoglycoside/choline kinase family phosphotransferase
MPRVSRYLERDLAHPDLARLRDWYDRHLPANLRASAA